MQRKDRIVLQKVLGIIEETEEIFADTLIENFLKNNERKMAMTMSILRIGELVKKNNINFPDCIQYGRVK